MQHATRRSLVVLDEIGRGTSTYDGMSIAWAVAEHLHDRIGCKTMFATHYHELTALAETRPRVRNFSTAVKEFLGPAGAAGGAERSDKHAEIVFLHKLVAGGASRSYGIQVARLAGLDKTVIARAKQILQRLESGDELGPHTVAESEQLSLLAPPCAGAAAPAAIRAAHDGAGRRRRRQRERGDGAGGPGAGGPVAGRARPRRCRSRRHVAARGARVPRRAPGPPPSRAGSRLAPVAPEPGRA